MNNKGVDQSERMRRLRLVCAFCCSQTPKDRFSRVEAHLIYFGIINDLKKKHNRNLDPSKTTLIFAIFMEDTNHVCNS